MQFLRWFSRKSPGSAPTAAPLDGRHTRRADDAQHRRHERLERRELLYAVVRECMTSSGLLSASYKFKVLSLDAQGQHYLIMVDMPMAALGNPVHCAEVEGAIARSAKERYDILVSAVYWRVNDLVTAGLSQQVPPHMGPSQFGGL